LKSAATVCPLFVRRLLEITSHQQQTQRTLLDWPRVEYEIAKPSNKLLTVIELDSDTWVGVGLVVEGTARKGSSPPSPSTPRRRRGE
jgi:hypothetical protein